MWQQSSVAWGRRDRQAKRWHNEPRAGIRFHARCARNTTRSLRDAKLALEDQTSGSSCCPPMEFDGRSKGGGCSACYVRVCIFNWIWKACFFASLMQHVGRVGREKTNVATENGEPRCVCFGQPESFTLLFSPCMQYANKSYPRRSSPAGFANLVLSAQGLQLQRESAPSLKGIRNTKLGGEGRCKLAGASRCHRSKFQSVPARPWPRLRFFV